MKNNIFINRYVMACAISIVIALVGYICMSTLPIEQYPNIAPPTVRVSTTYTGADANTIMKSVVQPLEEAINGVPDMTYMTSSASSSGDVSIVVYFKAGTDPDLAAVNVQNRHRYVACRRDKGGCTGLQNAEQYPADRRPEERRWKI